MFHPTVQHWFDAAFDEPTPCQLKAWPAIRKHRDVLVCAPTGSGKTLAAFLAAIDDLARELAERGELKQRTRVLYVSPLKALSNDIEKNLRAPLDAINEHFAERGIEGRISAAVRTGDTPPAARERMKKCPPHILVTTPESLYILLTSQSGRDMLSTVESVIVDEIHALAPNKRGAHLSLSLARLDAMRDTRVLRIGLSATQNPLRRVAGFLAGSGRGEDVLIVDDGVSRTRDIDLLLPDSPLEAVMAGEVWGEVYGKLAEQARDHRTTLVFVNTRRQAERVARHVGELLGEDRVTSHHGSLSREHRLDAETRLKSGALRVLVATASLELGIDIGEVDLVCQLGSPRSVSVFLQRVGRSGHGVGRVPKGRLIPLSRDDLVECVALLDCCRRTALDEIHLPEHPLDVLAQQIVAEVANVEWRIDSLYEAMIRATPYATLPRTAFDEVLRMLAEGFSTRRGRRGALIHVDLVNGLVRGRKGARLTALTNGGAIPDLFDYDVVLEPDGQRVGTLNEDFAFESLAGDIFQLGNTSYRILRVEKGTVRVADAKGQPPNIPFWFGEAPGRGERLSESVSELRRALGEWMAHGAPHAREQVAERFALDGAAASQLVDYLGAAWQALGGMLPTREHLVAERFFDDAGDMHLVIHSPFGSRLNRAFGLALRKRFCRRFNFELQAAALEDCVVLSLGATHSFDLDEVARYLNASSVRQVLIQALLDAPVFPTHWRWVTNIALAVKRFRNGRKVPAQFQRSDAEDLVAVVFPDQLACIENVRGEREVPAHPLVNQAIWDCLNEVMDIGGLEALLSRLEGGSVRWSGRDLVAPSPLAEEIINARPYAFLDDAPAEERRTLAVQSRAATGDDPRDYTVLDPAAVVAVRDEAWPAPAGADELHDALVCGGFLTEAEIAAGGDSWRSSLRRLTAESRAARVRGAGVDLWCAAERLAEVRSVLPAAAVEPDVAPVAWGGVERPGGNGAAVELIRSRLQILGPVSAARLAAPLALSDADIVAALEALRQEGFAIAGRFDPALSDEQWCDRRLLARIHRYTLKTLRARVEPVSLNAWLRFLFAWQHLDAASHMEGADGAAEVISQLEGCGVPLRHWEGEILPARVYGYHPALLDQLALSGRVLWRRCLGRLRRNASRRADGRALGAVPVAFYPRDGEQHWMPSPCDEDGPAGAVSASAGAVARILDERGPSFYDELQSASGMLPSQLEAALSELVAAGRVTCDSFNGLRGLLVPESRRRSPGRVLQRRGRRLSSNRIEQSGRWSLTAARRDEPADVAARDERLAYQCDVLLHRYGVVCRSVVQLERGIAPWRELLGMLRRLEARGEVRGGRFVAAFTGEQFALPEALEALRRHRRDPAADSLVTLHAADPVNVTGVILPGERISGHRVMLFRNGELTAIRDDQGVHFIGEPCADVAWRIREKLHAGASGARQPRAGGVRRLSS